MTTGGIGPVLRKPWTLLGFLVGVVALVAWLCQRSLMNLMPPCLFHRLTHLHCPGCGGRRCVKMLSHGRVPEALHMNALVICIGLGFTFVIIKQIHREWRFGQAGNFDVSPRLGWAIGYGVIAFWILRNIPLWPFTLLAPY
jgi:hypothetical protein